MYYDCAPPPFPPPRTVRLQPSFSKSILRYSYAWKMNSLTHVHRHLRHTIATTPRCWQWRSLVAANAALRPTPSFRRAFTERRSSPPEEPPKPKPKSSTALRRAASASLPIRSNPTPTRSDIHPIFTYATAERYLMPNLRKALPKDARLLHDAWWVPRWTDKENGREGEVFVFGNGSFVSWGLDEDGAARFAEEVIARSAAEVARLKELEMEDLEFVTDPQE